MKTLRREQCLFLYKKQGEDQMKEKKKLSLAMQIFIALVLAIIAGLLMQSHADFAESYIKPFGTIFLNLVKFIVVPIVLFSIMCGIISMSDIKKVGAIGLKTVIFYLCTTAFAVTIGLTGGNLFKGLFPVVATTDLTYEAAEATSFMDTIVNIFPSNFVSPMVEANMLQIIVMAILLGFAIILVGEKNIRVVNAFNDLNEIFMKCMEMILKLSPIGVFCLLCPVIAANGPTIIGSLAMVLLAAYICYIVHMLVVYSLIVKTMGGLSPAKFLKGMLPAIMFAFSSASSVGTSDQPGMYRKAWSKKRSCIFCTSTGRNDQYGWNCDLPGCLCDLYCILLWYFPYTSADADYCSYRNTGFHRNCRRARSGYDHAGNGSYICGTSGGWYCTCCRC